MVMIEWAAKMILDLKESYVIFNGSRVKTALLTFDKLHYRKCAHKGENSEFYLLNRKQMHDHNIKTR